MHCIDLLWVRKSRGRNWDEAPPVLLLHNQRARYSQRREQPGTKEIVIDYICIKSIFKLKKNNLKNKKFKN